MSLFPQNTLDLLLIFCSYSMFFSPSQAIHYVRLLLYIILGLERKRIYMAAAYCLVECVYTHIYFKYIYIYIFEN